MAVPEKKNDERIFSGTGKSFFCILLALAFLGGCGLGGPAYVGPATGAAAIVDMGMASFSAPAVTIRAGESVEWRNTSLVEHTVTDDPRLARQLRSALLPAGASAFDSGDIPPGQIYTRKFKVPGTYRYFCRYHESHGMVGTITVMR